MAKFKINDWVQIRLSPDTKWAAWDTDVHNFFCGRIGYIQETEPDPWLSIADSEEDLAKVVVYFTDNTFVKPGLYYTFFKKRHLIKSSEYEAKRFDFAETAASETNNFEEFTKNKRDQIFRYIFGYEEPKKEELFDEDIKFEDWEEKTRDYSI